MKNILVIPLLWFSLVSLGQNKSDNIFLSSLRLNFAIPDQPAFSILGSQPSDLLRPSSVNELSVIVSKFYNNNSISLPQAFAMEIAPGLLIKQNKIKLKEYVDNKFWYSIRLSVGSQKNKNNAYNLGLGFRATIIDRGDLISDPTFMFKIEQLSLKKLSTDFDIEEMAAKKTNDRYNHKAGDSKYKNVADFKIMDQKNREKKYYESCKKEITENWDLYQSEQEIDKKIKELKEVHKVEYWNKFKWDVAFAWLSKSPDSLVTNLTTKKIAAWTTWAIPCSKWGQLLIGVNYTHDWLDTIIDSTNVKKNYGNLSIPARLYAGKNRIKGFVEAQFKWNGETKKQDGLLNVGAEVNPIPGIWLVLNAGYTFNDLFTSNSTSNLYTHFDIRFAIPENFNFFK
jgi:hypothetical protein